MNRTICGYFKGVRFAGAVLLAGGCLAAAEAAAPSLTFYVPFPEADALTALTAVETGGSGSTPVDPMSTYISIAAIADGTVICYDQWEDGYEKDHDYVSPLQPTTQIWGDGNPANGAPPGVTNDLINAGTVIVLGNPVTSTSPLTIDYDARDKISSTRTISVTRTYWATATSTLFAGCVETFDTSKWGTEYRAPIGVNIPDSADAQMFEYTALSVMASRDATVVRIDADNNGTFETTNTLSEGQTAFVSGVSVGGRVLADKPVQVILFSGDVGSNYESRDSSLLPVNLWSSNYYTPVSTPNNDATRVWLYNPNAGAITVTYAQRVGTAAATTNTISVPAGSYAAVELTSGASARFFTTGGTPPVFYAYSTTDSDVADTSDNQAWDWSFTLIPQQLLSPQVLVGLGVGRDPLSPTNPNENGNPVWVTPVGNGSSPVTVYIDYNGDNVGLYTDPNGNKYDVSTNLIELQQAKLYDPDGDQTAMLVYVLSTNVTLAAAWGQDTLTATAGAPGLDVGTSIPPEDVIDASKNLTVVGDSDGDGMLGPSDRAEYLIRIGNTARAPIPADVVIKDALPSDTTYVLNSTAYRTSTNGAWVGVADSGSGTAFPLDDSGFRISASIPVAGFFEVRFRVDVDAYADLDAGRVSVVNTGSVFAVMFNRTITYRNETDLHGSLGDRVWNDADSDGVQDASEAGINGVLVYLDVNTNGVRDAGEPYDTTSGDGDYLLTGTFVEAGTHLVRVDRSTLPSDDYIQSYDLDGLGSPDGASVVLAGGEDRMDVDFGYRVPARLGDFAWVDADGNGVQDAGEPGLPNVVVRLYDSGGALVATTNTSGSGAYVFVGLSAGSYTVGFTPPAGYLFTESNVGSDTADSDPLAGTNRTAAVALISGQTDITLDAGFYLPASLAGSVFVDQDGDGVADAADTNGIAGVTIMLLDASSNTVATTSTSATGAYLFSNLAPGSYTAVQVLPGGYTNTLDVAGANDLRVPRTLTSGQNSTGNDFYDARTGSVAAQGKVLYLSDPSQSLDRVDPVASGDATMTNTATLISDAGTASITVAGAAASSTSTQTASSHSFTYNSGNAGANRILMVGISYRNNDGETVTGVTYGGTNLTLVGTAQIASGTPDGRIYIYQLLNPPINNNTLQVTWSDALNNGAVVGAVTYAGVSQLSPTNLFASASATTGNPAVTVPSAPGQLAFGVVGGRTTSAYAVSGGGSSLWSNMPFSNQTAGGGQSKAGASPSTSLTWTGTADEWVAGGVSLIPAPSGTSVATFTQAPAFSLPFNLDAGATVTVTGYVNVVSGTMPSTAAVAARLSVGGSVFLAVTNAAYSGGALVWTGTLPGAVAVAAGQAISLSVSNAQPGVEFQLRYDSATYPSKIILPTASIIAVPSLGVYDAAYPGGLPVTNSAVGSTLYVRATVTDPFGAYDISGVSLLADAAGTNSDVSVSLSDLQVVASNAWSKTYEYVWQTGAQAGDYQLVAVAREGTEGITATASARQRLYSAALFGYVFKDNNGDLLRNTADSTITNALVRLFVNGVWVSTIATDSTGFYRFDDIPLGTASVVVSRASATLIGVPTAGAPASDERRNRAMPKEDEEAFIVHQVYAGYGVLAETPGETLNFGFSTYPLSSAIDIRAYATGKGGVRIDIWTANESGNGDIVLFAWLGGAWVEIGRVPSAEVVGEGSNRYTLHTKALPESGVYFIRVQDESGQMHDVTAPLSVKGIRVRKLELSHGALTLTFSTEYGNRYVVKSCDDLSTPDEGWKTERVSVLCGDEWSDGSELPFSADSGFETSVRVVAGRARAYFKIVMADED